MTQDNRIKELEAQLEKCRLEIAELNSLLRSTELINSTLRLDAVLDYLMELAVTVTDSEASSALLLEDDKLYFVAASGLKSREVRRISLDKGEGIAGWVLQHGEPLHIPDVKADSRFSGRVDKSSGFVTRSILAVPLMLEDRVIGVIEALNKKSGGQFSDDDIHALSALAASAAMAVNKAQLYRDLNELFLSTIKVLANAIEAKDSYTRGHSERIRNFSLLIAGEMGISEEIRKDIEISALLHDVGKIGVPEAVLGKQGKLTAEERGEIMRHPSIGADMLSSIKQLKAALPGIRYHQERYDGKGYPEGLSGEGIPLFARIIAVADTFDAMTSDRPYRSGLPDATALAELERFRGVQFDPVCTDAFLRAYKKGLIKSQRSEKEETKKPDQPARQPDYPSLPG
ncbi:MAG: HD-GYP domain-containing protein [Endomicrobiales bacterium]